MITIETDDETFDHLIWCAKQRHQSLEDFIVDCLAIAIESFIDILTDENKA